MFEVSDPVLEVLQQNAATAQEIVKRAVGGIDLSAPGPWAGSLRNAIITDRSAVPRETVERLAPIVGKYFELGGEETP